MALPDHLRHSLVADRLQYLDDAAQPVALDDVADWVAVHGATLADETDADALRLNRSLTKQLVDRLKNRFRRPAEIEAAGVDDGEHVLLGQLKERNEILWIETVC